MRWLNWRRGRRYPLPAEVGELLDALTAAGYAAYAVGGGVRDLLLGKEPQDWDLATAARPEEIERVLTARGAEVIPQVGAAFAVALVRYRGKTYEVATFRGETYGADAHRPAEVYYADSLAEDVARRDFTVNALALDATGRLHDLVDGARDLRRRCLRTVGEPAERFCEDALRLFRACRLIAQVELHPTWELCAAMPAAFPRVAGLSLERVRTELERLLLAPAAGRGLDLLVRSGLAAQHCRVKADGAYREVAILPELMHLPQTPQGSHHAYDAWLHTLVVTEHTPARLVTRYGALFHDVAKGLPGIRGEKDGEPTDYGHADKGAELAYAALRRLGYSEAFARDVEFIVANHMKYHDYANGLAADPVRWLRKLARSGRFRTTAELVRAMDDLGAVCVADVIGTGRQEGATAGHEAFAEYLRECLRSMPVHTRDLNYPPELPQVCGKATGAVLHNLLRRVQDGQLPNEPAALLAAAKKHWERVKEQE